jgi:FPC/CPF motif-containing protein YcgG
MQQMILIHSAATIPGSFAPDSWQAQFFDSFQRDLTSKERTFPCTFGSLGSERGGLRFLFLEDFRDPAEIDVLAAALRDYIGHYKSIDRMTSLICFFNPAARLQTEEQYFRAFWKVLQELHERDEAPWPDGIPTDPSDPKWEFSFGGDSFFVVCNTPLHEHRLSRRAMGFYVTFQPRWVFEGITGDTKAGQAARRVIRKHLRNYDRVDLYPHMGNYGDSDNLEWLQYFIPDSNESTPSRCPFRFAGRTAEREAEEVVR